MIKFRQLIACVAVAGALLTTSCNSDETFETEPLDYSAAGVTAFSLKANKSVLVNLDSVFFSIDQQQARIYNADSLPYGTDISALGVTISTSTVAQATLHIPQGNGKPDKVLDYLAQPDSLIDFSHGNVRFHLVSADLTNARDYYIQVNVHTMVPDSLYWAELAKTALPGAPNSVGQKTVKYADKAYCLTTDGSAYQMNVSTDLLDMKWSSRSVSFPKSIQLGSFTATSSAMFILATDKTLLTSTDGYAWTSTGASVADILGASNDKLLCVSTDALPRLITYPAGVSQEMPADFPVAGYSNTLTYDTKWSATPLTLLTGGRTSTGYSSDTWAWDGGQWRRISSGLPAAEGYSMAAYTISETDSVSWRSTQKLVTLVFGGRNSSEVNKTVYISHDMGLTWTVAPENLQLPEYIDATYGADVLVFDNTLTRSRATQLITSWECPYLYMFGGTLSNGSLSHDVWRGVVNSLTFRPLQ